MSRSSLIISFAVVILPSDDFRKRQIFMQKIISNGNTATKIFLPKPTKGKRERKKEEDKSGGKGRTFKFELGKFFHLFSCEQSSMQKTKNGMCADDNSRFDFDQTAAVLLLLLPLLLLRTCNPMCYRILMNQPVLTSLGPWSY